MGKKCRCLSTESMRELTKLPIISIFAFCFAKDAVGLSLPDVHHYRQRVADDDQFKTSSTHRRRLLLSPILPLATTTLNLIGFPRVSEAAVAGVPSNPPVLNAKVDSLSLEAGLLEARVSENVLSPPPYGLERPDIFYPSWFSGTWRVRSLTTGVEAPCGVALFGGNATFQSAQQEIGKSSIFLANH